MVFPTSQDPRRVEVMWVWVLFSDLGRVPAHFSVIPSSNMANTALEVLATALVEEGMCASPEEARLLVGSIVDADSQLTEEAVQDIAEYMELNPVETEALTTNVGQRQREIKSDDSSVSSSETDMDEEGLSHGNDEDDEEECIGPGECVLCERYMKLSKHHLIPKATWNKLEYKIGSMESLSHMAEELERTSASYKQTLNAYTINVCGPCHRHIHKTHDHWTLATTYNTLDRLLDDPAIYKFAQWANRQRSGNNGTQIITRGRRCLKKVKKK